MTNALGIVGGLGPLASAEFLLSIYEHNVGRIEQDAPAVILYSQPGFPDRTRAFLEGNEELLLKPLERAMRWLWQSNASRIVIACVTIHHLVPRLPSCLQEMTISLTDVALDAVRFSQQPALLFATNGTRQMGVFEANKHWPEVQSYIVMPEKQDQKAIHERIYAELKVNCDPRDLITFLLALCSKYGVSQFIAGCTELHRISRLLSTIDESRSPVRIIDPLLLIAQNYQEFVHEKVQPYGRLCRALPPVSGKQRN